MNYGPTGQPGGLTVGSLFAGIGGLELGLERAGMHVRWQVEIDDYATRVLERHWPAVTRFRDVRECGAHNLEPVDLICGGFPCQDVSVAGQREGIGGERSGLWRDFARIVFELRPRWVVVENVVGLLSADAGWAFGTVLGDLAALGFDAEWSVLSACAVGAPHTRERVFILAHTQSERRQRGRDSEPDQASNGRVTREPEGCLGRLDWSLETRPPIERMVDGVPGRVDRLRTLGNAVVPQVAEVIGRWIVDAERAVTEDARKSPKPAAVSP